MKTIIAFATIATIAISPVIAVLTIILALFTLSIIASFWDKQVTNDAVLDQSYTDLKDAFDDIFDDTPSTPELSSEQVTTERSEHEPVITIDYSVFTYRELQQKVKALRTNKSIKLTAKKQQLIDWLVTNA